MKEQFSELRYPQGFQLCPLMGSDPQQVHWVGSLSSTSLGPDDRRPETGEPGQVRSYCEEGEGGFKFNEG